MALGDIQVSFIGNLTSDPELDVLNNVHTKPKKARSALHLMSKLTTSVQCCEMPLPKSLSLLAELLLVDDLVQIL